MKALRGEKLTTPLKLKSTMSTWTQKTLFLNNMETYDTVIVLSPPEGLSSFGIRNNKKLLRNSDELIVSRHL